MSFSGGRRRVARENDVNPSALPGSRVSARDTPRHRAYLRDPCPDAGGTRRPTPGRIGQRRFTPSRSPTCSSSEVAASTWSGVCHSFEGHHTRGPRS